MRKKIGKRLFNSILILAMIFSGIVLVPTNAEAVSQGVVQYQKMSVADFEEKIEKHEAPSCDMQQLPVEASGYLFGGWFKYTDDNTVGGAIRTVEDASGAQYVYAKFVPARLTGVSCQIGVDAEKTQATNLRVVSTVDSIDYKAVGFNVYGRQVSNNGVVDWMMYEYSSDSENPNVAQNTKVYSGLQIYKLSADGTTIEKDVVKYPADIFGADANGFKFTTMSLSSVGKDYYGTTIVIKPYWITLDGTYVEGSGEFNRVNDSPNITSKPNIVNISVNLKEASTIAAGMLSVTYPTGYTYVEAECGRVFDEMKFVPNGNTIHCVGNVADIDENAKKPNDVYVNLRFKKTDNSLLVGNSEFAVTVPKDSFCDVNEDFVDVTAWNVKY